MKSIIKELGIVEELVVNHAPPAEIRPHLMNLQKKLKATSLALRKCSSLNARHLLLEDLYSKLQKEHSDAETKCTSEIKQLKLSLAKQKAHYESQLLAYHNKWGRQT